MPITLINKQKRKRTFLLEGAFFADRAQKISVTVVEEARDGNRYPRRVAKKVPGVITLLAQEKRHGLPDQIIAVPAIKAAIADGSLSFLKVNVQAAAATTATKQTTKRRRGR